MNAWLARTLLLERMRNPIRLSLIVAVTAWPVVLALVSGDAIADTHFAAVRLALVFCTGAIGSDLSSGALHLVLTRPVTRRSTVFTTWMALGGASFVTAWLALLLSVVSVPHFHAHGSVTSLAVAQRTIETLGAALATAAVLIALGTMMRGNGNAAAWIAALILLVLLHEAMGKVLRALVPAIEEGIRTVVPLVSVEGLGTSAFQWTSLVSCVSTTVLALALAVVALNRKELPHAGA